MYSGQPQSVVSRVRRLRRVKVFTVVGNRPQFIKAAPLSAALREAGIDEVVLHTGQHWYHVMSQVFFDQLGARRAALPPRPAHVGHRARCSRRSPSGSPRRSPTSCSSTATRTRRSPARARPPTRRSRSRTSRPGCAAATSRCRRSTTGSRPTASPGSSSAPTTARAARSRTKGVLGRIYVVGDVMADASRLFAPVARAAFPVPHEPRSYVVATIHRQANVEQPRLGAHRRRPEPDRRDGRLPGPPAHARSHAGGRARARRARAPHRAAQLPRARVARVAGARDRHRLRRPAEGGVLVRRAVRHRPALDGVGRHGRGRRERARRRRSRSARSGGRERVDAARTDPSSTATGTPRSGSRRCSPLRSRADEARRRHRRSGLRRPASRTHLRRRRQDACCSSTSTRRASRSSTRARATSRTSRRERAEAVRRGRPRRGDDGLRRAARGRRDPRRAPDTALAPARARPAHPRLRDGADRHPASRRAISSSSSRRPIPERRASRCSRSSNAEAA